MSHFLHDNSDAHLPIQGDTSDNVNNLNGLHTLAVLQVTFQWVSLNSVPDPHKRELSIAVGEREGRSKTPFGPCSASRVTPRTSPELHNPERFQIRDYRPTRQSNCPSLGMIVYEVSADTITPLSWKHWTYTPSETSLIRASRQTKKQSQIQS